MFCTPFERERLRLDHIGHWIANIDIDSLGCLLATTYCCNYNFSLAALRIVARQAEINEFLGRLCEGNLLAVLSNDRERAFDFNTNGNIFHAIFHSKEVYRHFHFIATR